MNIIITGATGLVGAHLLSFLLKNKVEDKIRIPFRTEDKRQELIQFLIDQDIDNQFIEDIEWLSGDLLDISFCEDLLINDSLLFHCAAQVSFNKNEAEQMIENNVLISRNLVNVSLNRAAIRFVHLSSVAALGSSPEGTEIDESCYWDADQAHSPYSKSKYLSELEIWRGIAEGLEACIAMPSIVLGVYPSSKSSTAMFKMAYNNFPYYASGSNGFIGIQDLCKALWQMAQSTCSGERFILSSNNLTYKKVSAWMSISFGNPAPKKIASSKLAMFALIIEWFRVLFGKNRTLSWDLFKTVSRHKKYSNKKLSEHFDFQYNELESQIVESSKQYLRFSS
ncbi:MAG: NAD-dependent epimerase/dehydratase family protein, partial [Flavobacteriales bacterium]